MKDTLVFTQSSELKKNMGIFEHTHASPGLVIWSHTVITILILSTIVCLCFVASGFHLDVYMHILNFKFIKGH